MMAMANLMMEFQSSQSKPELLCANMSARTIFCSVSTESPRVVGAPRGRRVGIHVGNKRALASCARSCTGSHHGFRAPCWRRSPATRRRASRWTGKSGASRDYSAERMRWYPFVRRTVAGARRPVRDGPPRRGSVGMNKLSSRAIGKKKRINCTTGEFSSSGRSPRVVRSQGRRQRIKEVGVARRDGTGRDGEVYDCMKRQTLHRYNMRTDSPLVQHAGKVWAQRGYGRVGTHEVGEKNNSILAETLSKLRFFGTS
jgi:hypothetical protein